MYTVREMHITANITLESFSLGTAIVQSLKATNEPHKNSWGQINDLIHKSNYQYLKPLLLLTILPLYTQEGTAGSFPIIFHYLFIALTH